MTTAVPTFQWNRFLRSPSNLAVCFFLLSSVAIGIALLAGWGLVSTSGFRPAQDRLSLPPAFAWSTFFLVLGSWTLTKAGRFVRLEKQSPFRRYLTLSAVVGVAFVAVQTYALWCLLESQQASSVQTGMKDAVFVFAMMHGLHFVVALMFVLFVWLRAIADRYDHEYSWGVTVCGWFWHVLGVVWITILGAFVVGSSF